MSSDKRSIIHLSLIKIVGAILGVSYSILQVRYFGISRDVEIYFAASSVLYLITSLAQSGQLSELFLPVYHLQHKKYGAEAANSSFSVVLNRLFIYSLFIAIVAIAIAPSLVKLMIPGFSAKDHLLAIEIFRIMAILLVVTINSGFILTFLNANKIYGRAEIAGLVSTVVSVAVLLTLFDDYGVWSLVISYVIGRVIAFIYYIITLKNIGYKHLFLWRTEKFNANSYFMSMFSTAGYSGATQLYNVVLTASISFLPEGIFAVYKYTQQLTAKSQSIISQPLLTVFYTTFSRLDKDILLPIKVVVKKYISLLLSLNMVVIIITVFFGEYILLVLWGSDKFSPDKIELAYWFLIISVFVSAVNQFGGIFRKMAMSYGYGKLIYSLWTVAQLLTALSAYFLIKNFSVIGLFFVFPINGLLLSSVSFFIIFIRKNNLTKVLDVSTFFKTVIIILLLLPVGYLLNNYFFHGGVEDSVFFIIVKIGFSLIVLGFIILFIGYFLKLELFVFIIDQLKYLKKSMSRIIFSKS